MASRLPDKHGLEGLDLGQLRFRLHHRRHPLQAVHHLRVHRVRHPQRAVLVEGGQAGLGRHELRAGLVGGGFHEVQDSHLAGPSFQEGSWSWAWARVVKPRAAKNPMQKTTLIFLERFFPGILKSSLQP